MAWDPGRRVIKAGTGNARAAKGGVILRSVTAVGNIGAGVDDLISLTMPANTLYMNGQGLRIIAYGKFGADGNNKELILAFGGTTIADSGVITPNAKNWYLEALVFRTGVAGQDCIGRMQQDTTMVTPKFTATTIDETAAIIIKLTGETTDTDMIIAEGMFVEVLATVP